MHKIWNNSNLFLWENLSWVMRVLQERIPPIKCDRHLYTLHGIISLKTQLFITTAVRTSNPMQGKSRPMIKNSTWKFSKESVLGDWLHCVMWWLLTSRPWRSMWSIPQTVNSVMILSTKAAVSHCDTDLCKNRCLDTVYSVSTRNNSCELLEHMWNELWQL
jgi:hypothetical protein